MPIEIICGREKEYNQEKYNAAKYKLDDLDSKGYYPAQSLITSVFHQTSGKAEVIYCVVMRKENKI